MFVKKAKCSIWITAHILNAIHDEPLRVVHIAEKVGAHPETVRRQIKRMKADGLVHVAAYEISDLRTNQPTMVFGFGPGRDAARITSRELKKANAPKFQAFRDPFTEAFFGAAA